MEPRSIVERVCHRGRRNLILALYVLWALLVAYGVAAAVHGFGLPGLLTSVAAALALMLTRWARDKLFVELREAEAVLLVSGPLTGQTRIDLSRPGVRLADGVLSRNHAPRLHTPDGVVVLMALARSYDSTNLGPDPAVNNMIARLRLVISQAQQQEPDP